VDGTKKLKRGKMNISKPLLVIGFGIGWFIFHAIKYHRFEWLVPIVFVVIGLYLKSENK